MGFGGERIALEIDTTANTAGVREARAETTALGQAVSQAATDAAASQQKLTATIEQVRQAQAESNGDFTKFKQILADIVSQQTTLATVAAKTTSEIQKQTTATTASPSLAGPIGPQLGPALPGLTTRQARAASQASLNALDPSARKASNSLTLLTQAAITGQGSISGLANAAGHAAQGILLMSDNAEIAASATGIGVLIAAVGVLVAATIHAKEELDKLPDGKLAQAAGAHIANLHSEADIQTALANVEARRASLQAKLQPLGGLFGGNHALDEQKATLQAIVDLDAQREALQVRRVALGEEERKRTLAGIVIEAAAQTTATNRYAAQLRVIQSERDEAVRSHELTEAAADRRAATQRRALAKEGADYVQGLAETVASNYDSLTTTSFQARINAADRAYQIDKKAIQDRALSAADEKAALDYLELRRKSLVALAERERDTALATSAAGRLSRSDDPLKAIEGQKRLIDLQEEQDRKTLGAAEAKAIADEKRRQLQKKIFDEGVAGYARASAAASLHGSVVAKVSQAAAEAVRRYEILVQAKKDAVMAKSEFAASLAAYASGNVVGGTLHALAAAGYAASAIAGGAEAISGGGSAGGGGGSPGESSTFQPTGGSGGGAQTIVLQTVNPFSKEVINEAIYQINRSGQLKRPIPIAPTSGLVGAAA